jgi:hypothetical protein
MVRIVSNGGANRHCYLHFVGKNPDIDPSKTPRNVIR